MSSPFNNYDSWLVAPMERMMAESERFVDWCEEHNIDPDDQDAEMLYNDYVDSMYEVDFDDVDDDSDLREDFYDDYRESV